MSTAKIGAVVKYCGHNGVFLADIWRIGNVNVVKANGPIVMDQTGRLPKGSVRLIRNFQAVSKATHCLVDFPLAGYWRPQLGIFVVPHEQVTEL